MLAPHPAIAVVGRGFGFPVALEWALKLKELAGVFAEPFSAADYRHGPIALAANGAPVIALELAGPAAADVRRLGQDLRARGAKLVRASDELDADLVLPQSPEWLAPIPAAIAGQLLSFWLARARGRDPDYPVGPAQDHEDALSRSPASRYDTASLAAPPVFHRHRRRACRSPTA